MSGMAKGQDGIPRFPEQRHETVVGGHDCPVAQNYRVRWALDCELKNTIVWHEVNWPIDSLPFCPCLHDLRIACLKTYYKMSHITSI